MSDQALRSKLIRLAHEKPELRSRLLPLIRVARSYKEYVDDLPTGQKPMEQDEWETRYGDKGGKKDEGGEGAPKKSRSFQDYAPATAWKPVKIKSPELNKQLDEVLPLFKGDTGEAMKAHFSDIKKGKPIPPMAAMEALAEMDTLLEKRMKPADKQKLQKVYDHLTDEMWKGAVPHSKK
jgi:hypothetical protein